VSAASGGRTAGVGGAPAQPGPGVAQSGVGSVDAVPSVRPGGVAVEWPGRAMGVGGSTEGGPETDGGAAAGLGTAAGFGAAVGFASAAEVGSAGGTASPVVPGSGPAGSGWAEFTLGGAESGRAESGRAEPGGAEPAGDEDPPEGALKAERPEGASCASPARVRPRGADA